MADFSHNSEGYSYSAEEMSGSDRTIQNIMGIQEVPLMF
jgi:hypothetical protein